MWTENKTKNKCLKSRKPEQWSMEQILRWLGREKELMRAPESTVEGSEKDGVCNIEIACT